MAGRTGKLTAAELARRGPRIILARTQYGNVIFREDRPCFLPPHMVSVLGKIIAKSYTLSYLLKIGKYN